MPDAGRGAWHVLCCSTGKMTTQHLVIVRRGETQVFERLQAEFARGPQGAQVIWDRRVRDRRVIIQDVEAERRRGERRAPLDATMWTTRGYIVARPGLAADAAATPLLRPGRRTRRGGAGEPSA